MQYRDIRTKTKLTKKDPNIKKIGIEQKAKNSKNFI